MRSIWVVNNSSLVTDEQLEPVLNAVQKQIDLDFGPVWNSFATLLPLSHGEHPRQGQWFIELLDHASSPGALGYHMDDDTPYGVVGISDCVVDGVPWSSTLSHEILEMLADPWASLCCQVGGFVESLEVCDATEGDPYDIDGVKVENFVLPSWFRLDSKGPWDHLGKLKGPFTLLKNGYANKSKIGPWQQENAELTRAFKRLPSPLSRRARRMARWMP